MMASITMGFFLPIKEDFQCQCAIATSMRFWVSFDKRLGHIYPRYLTDRKMNISATGLSLAHYSDVIMCVMASQITSLTAVYSTSMVWIRHRSKKTSKLRVTGLSAGNSPMTGEFPAQRASNAENVAIWWRHHVILPYAHNTRLRVVCTTNLNELESSHFVSSSFSVPFALLRFTISE